MYRLYWIQMQTRLTAKVLKLRSPLGKRATAYIFEYVKG